MIAPVSSPTLIRLPSVCARTGMKKSQIYLLASRGEFPQPVKLGRHATAWVELEVSKWIQDRIARRDAAANDNAP